MLHVFVPPILEFKAVLGRLSFSLSLIYIDIRPCHQIRQPAFDI